jgi:uncharacterized protein (TIGR00255 family)
MESMTGYAFVESGTDQFSYSVELKTLNSRYLEVYVNLPRQLRNEEIDIQKLLRKRFERGKIELSLDVFDWKTAQIININSDLIKKYYFELDSIRRELLLDEPISLNSLLALEGISQRERSVISENSRKKFYASIERVCADALIMRKRDGVATGKDIIKLLDSVSRSSKGIKSLSKNAASGKKKELQARLENLIGSSLNENRLIAEIAILADRLDINEELVRLSDHILKFKSSMKNDVQTGRNLDFLAQEMFREANTIGSKSNNAEIAHLVVEIKNSIEKIREHCRNLV